MAARKALLLLAVLAVAGAATAEPLQRVTLKKRQLGREDADRLRALRYGLKATGLKDEPAIRLLNYLDAQVRSYRLPRHDTLGAPGR